MKKIIATLLVCGTISIAATAQEAQTTAQQPQTPEQGQRPHMTKEQREAMKHQREADLMDAMNSVQLTDDQKAKAKEAIETAGKQKNELRKDASLTEDQKKEMRKPIDAKLKTSLISIMGEDKYKKFKEFQKKTEEARKNTEMPKAEN